MGNPKPKRKRSRPAPKSDPPANTQIVEPHQAPPPIQEREDSATAASADPKVSTIRPEWTTAVFTAVIAAATIIYAYFTWGLWGVTEKAAITAERQLNYSERPWVSAKLQVVGPLIFDDPTTIQKATTLHLIVTLKNVGHSVALGVNDWEDIVPIAFIDNWEPAFARQRQYCDSARTQQERPGNPMFPDVEETHGSTVGPAHSIVDSLRLHENGLITFILVGCVDYRSTLDTIHHQTRFAYILAQPGNPFDPAMGGFARHGAVNGLVPMSTFIGGNSVD
jgi:hypothetical protein